MICGFPPQAALIRNPAGNNQKEIDSTPQIIITLFAKIDN
jgi:hypothetical protein